MILCVILGLLVIMLLPESKKKSFINSWLAFFLFLAFAAAFDLADVFLAELETVSFMSYLPDLDFMLILARLP